VYCDVMPGRRVAQSYLCLLPSTHLGQPIRRHSAAPQTGRPFVLVIDSADRLARNEESEKVLQAMVAYARDWAQVRRARLRKTGAG